MSRDFHFEGTDRPEGQKATEQFTIKAKYENKKKKENLKCREEFPLWFSGSKCYQ